MIDVIVGKDVISGEFLQTSHAPEAEHGPFSSSKRQVRILCSIVQPTTGFLPVRCANLVQRRSARAEQVRDDHLGPTVFANCFL